MKLACGVDYLSPSQSKLACGVDYLPPSQSKLACGVDYLSPSQSKLACGVDYLSPSQSYSHTAAFRRQLNCLHCIVTRCACCVDHIFTFNQVDRVHKLLLLLLMVGGIHPHTGPIQSLLLGSFKSNGANNKAPYWST